MIADESRAVDRMTSLVYIRPMRLMVALTLTHRIRPLTKFFISSSLLLLLMAAPVTAANSARNFGGVGIDGVPWADGRIVVKQLVAGGPAELAGMKAGDIITHIDGKPTVGSNFGEMVGYRLRGVAGTPLTIVARRPGSPKPLTFKLVRRQLVLPPNQ